MGGEEFALLFVGESQDGAARKAEAIRAAVACLDFGGQGDGTIGLTISAGVSEAGPVPWMACNCCCVPIVRFFGPRTTAAISYASMPMRKGTMRPRLLRRRHRFARRATPAIPDTTSRQSESWPQTSLWKASPQRDVKCPISDLPSANAWRRRAIR
jgi:hypothetical protein